MTRISALEAVALAAKKFRKQATEAFTPVGEKNVWDALDEAIKALDACPQAEPASRALDAFCKAAWPGAEPVEGRPERPADCPDLGNFQHETADHYERLWFKDMVRYANQLEAYATTLEQRLGVKP